jgi:hypothetical protein
MSIEQDVTRQSWTVGSPLITRRSQLDARYDNDSIPR